MNTEINAQTAANAATVEKPKAKSKPKTTGGMFADNLALMKRNIDRRGKIEYTAAEKRVIVARLRKVYDAKNKKFQHGSLTALRKETGITYLTAIKFAEEAGMKVAGRG